MNLTTLFEKVAGKQKQREQARVNDFRSLVAAIANGQEPDADRVDAVLYDSGQSLDDLRAAVEQLQKRKAMKAQLDTMPNLEAERADLETKIGKATEILNAAEAKYAEMVNPLRWRVEVIKGDLQQMWNLPQQLVETCPYPGTGRAGHADRPAETRGP